MELVQEERKIAVLSCLCCQYMDPKVSLLHLQDFSRLFVIYFLFYYYKTCFILIYINFFTFVLQRPFPCTSTWQLLGQL